MELLCPSQGTNSCVIWNLRHLNDWELETSRTKCSDDSFVEKFSCIHLKEVFSCIRSQDFWDDIDSLKKCDYKNVDKRRLQSSTPKIRINFPPEKKKRRTHNETSGRSHRERGRGSVFSSSLAVMMEGKTPGSKLPRQR